VGGFVSGLPECLEVVWDCSFPEDTLLGKLVEESLGYDPRPAYQSDEERVYGCMLGGSEVKWCVREGVVRVLECEVQVK